MVVLALGGLVVLTLATLMNRPEDVTALTDSYEWLMHRRLHHPHGELRKYLMCTRLLSTADKNWDNSLDLVEFADFSNSLADARWSQQVGQNLPKQLRVVFTEYATRTEGKSNSIIDIYGSRNGERDGITGHQEELLEELCNVTGTTLENMFGAEHARVAPVGAEIGVKQEETVPTEEKKPNAPQTLAINTSFTMTMPDNMTADDLNLSLETGEDPGHLQHAFQGFVGDVVAQLAADEPAAIAERNADDEGEEDSADEDSSLDEVSVDDDGVNSTTTNTTNTTARRGLSMRGSLISAEEERPRRLNIRFGNNSAQIYKYVESLCPGQVDEGTVKNMMNAIGNLIPQNNETSSSSDEPYAGMSKKEIRCVTAMGKFKIEVEEDEEEIEREGGMQSALQNVYQMAVVATKSAVDSGALEKKLEEEPDGDMFHVEGHGVVEDDAFDPYEEVVIVEVEETEGLRTVDIILISVGSVLIFCLCCVLCFVELERKTRPRPGANS